MKNCNTAPNNQRLLTNVVIIRPVLIVLVVFYHAFAIFGGGWSAIDGFPEVKVYWWLDKLSYAFLLESFVFVSGYVFGYQVRTKGEKLLEGKNLFWSKFKRLIIPSMFFSLLYIVLFEDVSQPFIKTLYSMIDGVGHMWFLPMLFWCFVGIWIIEKLQLKPRLVLPLLILSSIFSFVPLPLQMGVTMYYFLFFYIGYIIQRKDVGLTHFYTQHNVIILATLFLIVFPLLTIFRTNAEVLIANKCRCLSENQLIQKAVLLSATKIARLVYSIIGLSLLFVIVGFAEKKRKLFMPYWVISIGSLSMGVYIFQQFILKGVYFHSALPHLLGPYLLPWFGFVLTLILSLLLSYVMRLTKIGRLLIG